MSDLALLRLKDADHRFEGDDESEVSDQDSDHDLRRLRHGELLGSRVREREARASDTVSPARSFLRDRVCIAPRASLPHARLAFSAQRPNEVEVVDAVLLVGPGRTGVVDDQRAVVAGGDHLAVDLRFCVEAFTRRQALDRKGDAFARGVESERLAQYRAKSPPTWPGPAKSRIVDWEWPGRPVCLLVPVPSMTSCVRGPFLVSNSERAKGMNQNGTRTLQPPRISEA